MKLQQNPYFLHNQYLQQQQKERLYKTHLNLHQLQLLHQQQHRQHLSFVHLNHRQPLPFRKLMNRRLRQQQQMMNLYHQHQLLRSLKYKSNQQNIRLLHRHHHRLWSVCFQHRLHQLRLHKLFEYQREYL
jgi:hypothetical protein